MSSKESDKRLKIIGNRIRELRIENGFSSHEAFADMHGFTRKQIWRLESGENFQMNTLFRLIDIHGISLKEFFDGIQE